MKEIVLVKGLSEVKVAPPPRPTVEDIEDKIEKARRRLTQAQENLVHAVTLAHYRSSRRLPSINGVIELLRTAVRLLDEEEIR